MDSTQINNSNTLEALDCVSRQQNLQPTCKQLATDTISRQALNVQADYLIGNDSWFDCGDAVDPDDRGGCEWCNLERKDWKESEIPVDLGDFGEYQLDIYINRMRQAICVDFGEKQSEPILSVYSEKIKYCPYCGRKMGDET